MKSSAADYLDFSTAYAKLKAMAALVLATVYFNMAWIGN